MNYQCQLSNVIKEYLNEFYSILDTMICGMTEAKLTDSISANFIVQMIPHHRAAIQMSENLLKYTTNIALQNIALRIIEEQTKSIDTMQKVKCVCDKTVNNRQDLCQYQQKMNQIMQIMFSRMENAPATNQLNVNFIREMIPHHEGAVEMSETTLRYEICPELKPILSAIIVSQKRGIAQMQQLLCRIRCEGHE